MEKIETTSMSSKGQVVIPRNLREKLNIKKGEKFIVIGSDETILLKKIQMPSFKGFEKLLKETRKFVKEKNIKESDVDRAIKRTRKK